MNEREILDAIVNGDVDEGMENISNALRNRRKALEARKRLDFSVGDRVVFNRQARPQYLRGIGAEVVGLNPQTIVLNVDTDLRARRFSGSKSVKCPVAIVDKVEVPAHA